MAVYGLVTSSDTRISSNARDPRNLEATLPSWQLNISAEGGENRSNRGKDERREDGGDLKIPLAICLPSPNSPVDDVRRQETFLIIS